MKVEVSGFRVRAVFDDDACPDHELDRRNHVPFRRAVHRSRLASDALGLVVHEVRDRAVRLDVRRHPPLATFRERGERHRELSRDRQTCDQRGEPGASAYKPFEAGEHISLWYGRTVQIATFSGLTFPSAPPSAILAPMAETIARPDEANINTAQRCLNVFRSIVRALNMNSRAIELRTGLSLAQVFVLQELEKRPAETMGELAERTATHPSSVSVVARRLSERGLVAFEVDSTDRRRRRLEITDVGRDVVKRAPTTIQTQLIAGLETIEPDKRERLAALMEQWLSNAGVDLRAPSMLLEDEQA